MIKPKMNSPNQKVKIGIIGAGRIGKLHAEHLAFHIKDAEPMTISDIIETAAQETAANCNIPLATKDYRQILDDKSIDAVVICSPTDTHAQIIQEAADAGKHVFCEKPIDLDLNRIEQVLEVVEKAGVKFQVGFNRRFDANFLRVKRAVTNDEIGKVHILRITSRDPEPPPLEYLQHSGGIFFDMTTHDFDMARYVMGSEVEEVFAMGGVLIDERFRKANDLDTVIINLKFENGAIGTIDNSRQAVYGYDQRIEVFGSKGMIKTDNKTPDNHILLDADSVQSCKPLYFFLERYKDSFIAELQAFVDAIINDKEPPVTGHDGLMPIKLGMAAKKSFMENRPVKLSEI